MRKKSDVIGKMMLIASLFCMSSCEKESALLVEKTQETLSGVTVDETRIIRYTKGQVGTRAFFSEEIVVPELPAGVQDMVESWQIQQGVSYKLDAGHSYAGDMNFNNNDYYVYGDMQINNHWGSGGTLYVMPGGKLTMNQAVLQTNVTVVNLGELVLPDAFTVNSGATLKTIAGLSVETLQVQGMLYVKGESWFENLTVANAGVITFDSCVTIEASFTLTNDALVKVGSCLSAHTCDMSVNASILLDAASYLRFGTVTISNSTGGFNNGGEDYAVIECDRMIVNQADQRGTRGYVDIHAGELVNQSGGDVQWLSGVIFGGNTYIAGEGCKPSFGVESSVPQKVYKLDHIGMVASMKEGISASSVDLYGGSAFVSWHKYGDETDGYMDVIRMADYNLTATYRNETLDFNHIHVSDGKVYVAGGGRKGACIGEALVSDLPAGMILTSIAGASGNCVLPYNGKLWAVSGSKGGLSVLGAELLFEDMAEAKYIVKHNNHMVLLSGISDTRLSFYNLDGSRAKAFSIGSIAPENGKNTLATDGETIYVALGQYGVKAIRGESVVAGFSNETEMKAAAANCVDVDDAYVYVANGVAGLYILDKQNLSLVHKYTLGGASANFVKKGSDGLIYVSYGLKGVNFFRLIEE